jgi:hypothetical protein
LSFRKKITLRLLRVEHLSLSIRKKKEKNSNVSSNLIQN